MSLGVGSSAVLVGGAAVAGWVDAVIGGGGLILIPLIMAVMPQLAPAVALATNKLAAVSGTASAAYTLTRKVDVDKRRLLVYVPVAMLCSGVGALAASMIAKEVMRPIVIVLMLFAGIFVALKPDFGEGESLDAPARVRRIITVVLVGCIAFYDGIFGPGTGMFLIMVFTGVLSQNFLASAALTKVVNTSTNVGALVVFIIHGQIWWQLGLLLAVANIAGAQLGARTVLGGGTKLIRYALLTMVVVMSCYLAKQQWG
ncbi:TSUP family transporter [Corynebacterium epidermidicanis]|uniref:Probable membrane transporter protein n=1 Tax=Corynebacterium epidermidicanis TaxID=1050174 RepID=A0A0G3GLK7_9CORY|nr:TSUP family transporter [Corynebacterium epidermidicanis]AKK02054.1 putative permease [Corynebacterium epidermidicanis]